MDNKWLTLVRTALDYILALLVFYMGWYSIRLQSYLFTCFIVLMGYGLLLLMNLLIDMLWTEFEEGEADEDDDELPQTFTLQ